MTTMDEATSHLPELLEHPVTELGEHIYRLLDDPTERLPLVTLNEMRAAVLLLRILAAGDGEGSDAALELASRLSRRLPSE